MEIPYYFPEHGQQRLREQLGDEITRQLKILLEEKHLYQKVTVEAERIASAIGKNVTGSKNDWQRMAHSVLADPVIPGQSNAPSVQITFPVARLFCSPCDERTVFKPIWYKDTTIETWSILKQTASPKFGAREGQLFVVAYQCQHCQAIPEGFLIRKEGWRFSLDGRSPMEEVQVPAYIPKKEKNLYRDALISRFAGKYLASVFYLRSFVEQFARRQTQLSGRENGDEIMEAYAAKLPVDKRDHMPSLREWYGKLSVPIHSADEAAAETLFDTAREEIDRHFDIRRVFKIAEV